MTMEEIIEKAIEAWQNDPDANPHFPEDGEQTLAQAIAQALSGICVEARLEWERLPDRDGDVFEARNPFGSYVVHDWGNAAPSVIVYAGHRATGTIAFLSGTEFPTLEAAQQACQSDFASRISSCLKTRTVEEVRREYLEELIARADDECAEITDSSPSRMREALSAACWLRHLQQEDK